MSGRADPGQDRAVAFLRDPVNHDGAPVTEIVTHISRVFLAGDWAYKLKRAVANPFLDYSTPARRRTMIRHEHALNAPNAPGLYRGVRALVDGPDGLAWSGDTDDAVDWVVAMRRLPAGEMLDAVASEAGLDPATLDAVAEAVAALHGRAPRIARPDGSHFPRIMTQNLVGLATLSPPLEAAAVRALAGPSHDLVAAQARRLHRRARQHLHRVCHGDLHLANMVRLDGRPVPFDGIEFNDDLSHIDPIYDLAYLLMDLAHRGLTAGANRVMNRYLDLTGDWDGAPALPVMMATRAAIRAKVHAMTGAGGGDLAAADAYLAEARHLVAPGPVPLIAIGGVQGTGKSTVARRLAPTVGTGPGAAVLRTDLLRKRLWGVAETVPLPPAAYTPKVSTVVYRRLERWTYRLLTGGMAVFCDATFTHAGSRARIAEVAARTGRPFIGLWLDAPRAVLARRIEARTGDASDATVPVMEAALTADWGPMTWHRIDASGDPDTTATAAAAAVAGQLGG